MSEQFPSSPGSESKRPKIIDVFDIPPTIPDPDFQKIVPESQPESQEPEPTSPEAPLTDVEYFDPTEGLIENVYLPREDGNVDRWLWVGQGFKDGQAIGIFERNTDGPNGERVRLTRQIPLDEALAFNKEIRDKKEAQKATPDSAQPSEADYASLLDPDHEVSGDVEAAAIRPEPTDEEKLAAERQRRDDLEWKGNIADHNAGRR